MNQKDKDNLIGYDPLAWMNAEDETPAVESQSLDKGLQNSNRVEVVQEVRQGQRAIAATRLEDESKIILKTTQNLQNISELHEKLINALENTSGVIEIDASAIHSIDTATLQVFVALKQEVIRINRDLLFDFPSERFLEATGLLGISSLLNLDKIAAGLF